MRQLLRERTAEKWSHLDAETRKRHLETIAQYILDERGQVGSFVDMWIKTTFEGGSEAVAHGAQWAALGCRLMLLACRQPASKFPHIAPYRWRADTALGLADERRDVGQDLDRDCDLLVHLAEYLGKAGNHVVGQTFQFFGGPSVNTDNCCPSAEIYHS